MLKEMALAAVVLQFVAPTAEPAELCRYELYAVQDPEEYLWDNYKWTLKVDKHGDFTWKDIEAAGRAGMSVRKYVIGKLDPDFRQNLTEMFRAMRAAGLDPRITSGFRGDFRQSIAVGNKAAVGDSFHGGSKRGGRGLAADIVSGGKTRGERLANSPLVWRWVDEHGKLFGIGRPYGDRDAPHVAPVASPEFKVAHKGKLKKLAAKRKQGKKTRLAKLQKKEVEALVHYATAH